MQQGFKLPLISSDKDIHATLIELILINICSNPKQSSEFLIENSDLISSFLKIEASNPFSGSNFGLIVYVLDLILGRSVPMEQMIEMKLKQILMKSSNKFRQERLLNLENDPFFKERGCFHVDLLASVLDKRFKVSGTGAVNRRDSVKNFDETTFSFGNSLFSPFRLIIS